MDTELVKHIFQPIVKQQYQDQFTEMIYMDKAFGMMLVKQGLLKLEEYRIINQGLTAVQAQLTENDLRAERIDLYFNITDRLYEEVGEKTGCRLHVGRSRNDMGCTCKRMQIRKALWTASELVNQIMSRILEAAEENADTVMTFNTFGQPAQPGTFGHYLMTAYELLARDYRRFQYAYNNTNRCPLGAAAGMGSIYDIDRQYLCELLGFDSVIENTLDAVGAVDYVLDTETAFAVTMSDISRVAQDFIMWSSAENHILDFDMSVATGSSIMPQKKNPICLEHMRARTANALGLLNAGLATCRNTSLFPNVDASLNLFLQFSMAFDEVIKALELLKLTLEHCSIREKTALEHSKEQFICATAMAEYLAWQHQIPFEETHHVVREAVMYLTESGTRPPVISKMSGSLIENIAKKELGREIHMSDDEAKRMLDPVFCVQYRMTDGSPKPDKTKSMIEKRRQDLQNQTDWLNNVKAKVESAYDVIDKGL